MANNIEDMKKELDRIKLNIRERHEQGEESDELVQKVVESTRLARLISERMRVDGIL